jgi:hypothetical protein
MTAAELWKIFDEECGKMSIVALTFGDGISGHINKNLRREGPPEDLTLWQRVLDRIEPEIGKRAIAKWYAEGQQ